MKYNAPVGESAKSICPPAPGINNINITQAQSNMSRPLSLQKPISAPPLPPPLPIPPPPPSFTPTPPLPSSYAPTPTPPNFLTTPTPPSFPRTPTPTPPSYPPTPNPPPFTPNPTPPSSYLSHMIPNPGTFAHPQLYPAQPPPHCTIPAQYTVGQMPSLPYPPPMIPTQSLTPYHSANMNNATMLAMWHPNYSKLPYPYEAFNNDPINDPKSFKNASDDGRKSYDYPGPSHETSGNFSTLPIPSWNRKELTCTPDVKNSYDRQSLDSGMSSYCESSYSRGSQRSSDSRRDYDQRSRSDDYRSRSPSTSSRAYQYSRSSTSHKLHESDNYHRTRRQDDRFDNRSEHRRYDRHDKCGIRNSSPSHRRLTRRSSRSPTYRRSRSRTRSQSRSRSRSQSRSASRSSKRTKSASVFSVRSHAKQESLSPSPERRTIRRGSHIPTERESLVERWRMNNCSSMQEMTKKLEELSQMNPEQIIEHERRVWTRSAPGDLFYRRDPGNAALMTATQKLISLCERFEKELVKRSAEAVAEQPPYNPPPRKTRYRVCKHKTELCSSSSDESSSDEEDRAMEELDRKKQHPQRLHPELWHNDLGEMNDGPLCRCSHKARRSGIRHNVYVGEEHLNKCNINTNNADKLHHYRITVSPPVNFLTKTPTIIHHDSHEYIFEGFSMFSHFPLKELPTCKVIRFNIEYTILYIDETPSENFTIRELDLFYDYLFKEVLELVDLDLRASGDGGGCNQFHFMPRFVRDLPENGKEILSMNEVLNYLLVSSQPLISPEMLPNIQKMSQYEWQVFADEVKCMVVTYPGKKPCSLRVDQLDREQNLIDSNAYPEIVHFGIRPPQLSYAGNPEYQKVWRDYVKFRHLLANMPKPSQEDKRKLANKESRLQEMRTLSKMKRDVTIALTSQGFYRTGIMCDIIQHAMLLPVLVCHLRFHRSLDMLEKEMDYKFNNRYLLQLALTHPSYRENFGTNPDHARNSLTNCGIRQPEYGDRRIHYMNTRKRGINTLIQIMSRFGKKTATESNIGHNERLEFLGDAVVEFITSIHLFHLFPDLEEGGLATYRAAIVQNQHLAILAQKLKLDAYMLYAHGSDLCHDLELRHAMANCFEALMGALFLDGGIEVADKVFGETLFKQFPDLVTIWANYPLHPLQEQEPDSDRQWIQHFTTLQKLTEFEEQIGVEFRHIRLLARAFTDRSVGYTNLTLGSNQRLEFLGDTVLQIIASEYLYKFFPEHHEGHLSLLRSSLVNNRTQAVVCDDLGMTQYAIYSNPKADIKTKDRADLLEAFLGALYVDKGLKHCHVFCEVCFFPRLQDFIMNQDWNDPKSKLQQCCLTLRTMEGGEPDIPVYKVIECMGPTNTRVYTVAVYFRGERLAQASGHSIQQAEMNAAKEAISMSKELFPQLDHQKRVIAKSMKKQRRWRGDNSSEPSSFHRSGRLRRSPSRERSISTASKGRSPDRDKRRNRDRDSYDRSRDRDGGRLEYRSPSRKRDDDRKSSRYRDRDRRN